MSQTARDVLAQAQLLVDDDTYLMVKIHPRGVTAVAAILAELSEPFCAMLVDAQEITLFIEQEAFEEYRSRLPQSEVSTFGYRLITLGMTLEPTLTGLMAALASALAQAGVPILPLAAYSRDHILVPGDQLQTALDALHQLQKDSRLT